LFTYRKFFFLFPQVSGKSYNPYCQLKSFCPQRIIQIALIKFLMLHVLKIWISKIEKYSSFIIHHSSFIIHHSSFIIHH